MHQTTPQRHFQRLQTNRRGPVAFLTSSLTSTSCILLTTTALPILLAARDSITVSASFKAAVPVPQLSCERAMQHTWYRDTIILTFLLCCLQCQIYCLWKTDGWNSHWDDWWHYKEGQIGGPSQWGSGVHMAYIEDVWPACQRGRRQSPVNIATEDLVYDHSLGELTIDGNTQEISITVINMGQDVAFRITQGQITVRGGPLSYSYQLFGAVMKFGSESSRGSDHQINGKAFPAELQLYGYNKELYHNASTAIRSPNGLMALSVLMKLGEVSSKDLHGLIMAAELAVLKGQRHNITGVTIGSLLPSTNHYMTYEGSLPFPACQETVTWIILNMPLSITETELKSLRSLRISRSPHSGGMADNFRPLQNLNNRAVRTNINVEQESQNCEIKREVYYTANLPRS